LIQNGATINFPDCAGWTPLHVAVMAKRPYICYLLLKNGADLRMQNIRKQTPCDLINDLRITRVFRLSSLPENDEFEFISSIEDEEIERERKAKFVGECKNCVILDKESYNKEKYVEQLMNRSLERPMKLLKKASLQRSSLPKLLTESQTKDENYKNESISPFSNFKPIAVIQKQHP